MEQEGGRRGVFSDRQGFFRRALEPRLDDNNKEKATLLEESGDKILSGYAYSPRPRLKGFFKK